MLAGAGRMEIWRRLPFFHILIFIIVFWLLGYVHC